MQQNDVNAELPVQVPSKSKCTKILKQVFGSRVRYQKIDGDGLAVVEYVADGDGRMHERHLVEVRPKEPRALEAVHWFAMVAAFNAIGYGVELGKNMIQLVPRKGRVRTEHDELFAPAEEAPAAETAPVEAPNT